MMRTRPPDNLTGHEVASSNTTLNAFLGGKAKSWMTGSSSAVRPTPRPTLSQRTSNATSVLPSPAPSDEPSPVQIPQQIPNNDNQIAEARPTGSTLQAQTSPHNNRPQMPSRLQPSYDFQAQSLPQESRVQVPPHAHNVDALQHQRGLPAQNPSDLFPSQSFLPSQHPLQAPQPRPQLQAANSPIAVESSPPSNNHPALVSLQSDRGRPHKRPRTNANYPSLQQEGQFSSSNIPSLFPKLLVIDAYIQETGGAEKLNDLERPRFTLLRDACNNEDFFYVALHQLSCLWSIDRAGLQKLNPLQQLGFGDFKGASIGLKIVAQLIRDNDLISQGHLGWFAMFPAPIDSLLATSDYYRDSLSRVANFLYRLSMDWQNLTKECQQRGYPPLVDEMVNRLGLISPVLQGVFFTASRRNIGIKDDEIGHRMEKLYAQDRNDQMELARRFNTDRPPTQKEITDRNAKLAERYLYYSNQQKIQDSQRRHTIRSACGGRISTTPALGSNTQHNPNSRQGSISQNPIFTASSLESPSLTGRFPPTTPVLGSNTQRNPNSRQGSISQNPTFTASPLGSPGLTGRFPSLNVPRPAGMIPGSNPGGGPISHHYGQPLQNTTTTTTTTTTPHQSPQLPSTLLTEQSFLQSQYGPSQWNVSAPMTEIDDGASHRLQQEQLNHTYRGQVVQEQFLQTQEKDQRHQLAAQHASQPFYQQQGAPQVVMHSTPQQNFANDALQQIQTNRPVDHLFHTNSGPGRPQGVYVISNGVSSSNASAGRTISTYSPRIGPGSIVNSGVQASNFTARVPSQSFHLGSIPGVRAVSQYRMPESPRDVIRLIPEYGITLPAHAPNPDITALHQAHLRSPILTTKEIPAIGGRHYQAIQSCILGPVALHRNFVLSKFEFVVPEHMFQSIAKDENLGPGLPFRRVRQGSLQFRLRCVQMKDDALNSGIGIPDWVVADCIWPPSICIEVNGQVVEMRRKNLHAKDLPIDVTALIVAVQPNAPNFVKVALPRPGKNHKDNYAIAVEAVEVFHHQQIIDMCLTEQRIPAKKTLNAIKSSLSNLDDDEDISMVVSDLTIDLADPFMARIFEIPVRGNTCLHRECFDLETFLNTRNSKPKRLTQPSMVDVWKCPLCGKDARPRSLQVDDFLLSVRKGLEERDLLDTKAITISANGTWVPKIEPLPQKRSRSSAGLGDDSGDESEAERQSKSGIFKGDRQPSMGPPANNLIEIIELDD